MKLQSEIITDQTGLIIGLFDTVSQWPLRSQKLQIVS